MGLDLTYQGTEAVDVKCPICGEITRVDFDLDCELSYAESISVKIENHIIRCRGCGYRLEITPKKVKIIVDEFEVEQCELDKSDYNKGDRLFDKTTEAIITIEDVKPINNIGYEYILSNGDIVGNIDKKRYVKLK